VVGIAPLVGIVILCVMATSETLQAIAVGFAVKAPEPATAPSAVVTAEPAATASPVENTPEADPVAPAASASDVTERLRKLKALYDEGVLEEDVYKTKRQQLVDEL
jgi:hypothetical protein